MLDSERTKLREREAQLDEQNFKMKQETDAKLQQNLVELNKLR